MEDMTIRRQQLSLTKHPEQVLSELSDRRAGKGIEFIVPERPPAKECVKVRERQSWSHEEELFPNDLFGEFSDQSVPSARCNPHQVGAFCGGRLGEQQTLLFFEACQTRYDFSAYSSLRLLSSLLETVLLHEHFPDRRGASRARKEGRRDHGFTQQKTARGKGKAIRFLASHSALPEEPTASDDPPDRTHPSTSLFWNFHKRPTRCAGMPFLAIHA